MKRVLVDKKRLNEDTVNAIQYDEDVKRGKIVPKKMAHPMRQKDELSSNDDTEIGLPSKD